MDIFESTALLTSWKNNHKQDKVCFVPTMGALHEGHLALVEAARQYSDVVIVSIFVNPTQFAAHEDLDNYPRKLDEDIQKLKALGVSAVWVPSVKDIYPDGADVDVQLGGITQELEGAYRPHFFDGVATVVKRLFEAVQPTHSFFGEKDFQQLQVIRQLVDRYSMEIEIIGVPTVRDKAGLALSSRNTYLSTDELVIARTLNIVLQKMAQLEMTQEQAERALLDAGFDKVDYITARNSQSFQLDNPDRVLAAAWIGKTRLIDNMVFLHSD